MIIDIIQALIFGYFSGVLLSFTFGTVFFSLIQNSIDFGYKRGIQIASGVVFSDALLISMVMFGTEYLPQIPRFSYYVSLIGGIVLVGIGIFTLLQKKAKIFYPTTTAGDFFYFFSTGFLLNILNPINFFSWASVCTYIRGIGYTPEQLWLYVGASLLGIFSIEYLISYYSEKLKRFCSEQNIAQLRKLTGIVFVVIGLRLLFFPK